jgi:4-hydroxy-tetrahydrodipicolinate synthase
MTSTPKLRGVIAAIATPITPEGLPDAARFVALAQHLLENGCEGLNVLGTTGEATSFTVEQRMGLMTAVARAGLPLDRLMVGTGAAAVGDACRLTEHGEALGFAGALLLPPFYYKGVTHEGVLAYLDRVAAKARQVPLYLYHFPAQSGVPYEVELVERLLDAFGERVAGLKDSSGDLAYSRAVAALRPLDRFGVFPSNEAALMDARSGGPFAGCISATANLNADLCARAYREGDAEALAKAVAIRRLFDGRALVAGVKALLAHIHRDSDLARTLPPLSPLSADDVRAVVAGFEHHR